MTPSVAITLPGGLFANGERWREVHLRALTGEDHLFLTDGCRGLLPAQWVTEALTRCVTRLGPVGPVNREIIRSLSAGDREALLIHLRRLTGGDRMRCVLTCSSPACGEKLEIDLSATDLLRRAPEETRREHELTVWRDDGASIVVRFRLPTGSDQEAAAALALTDPDAAADYLLRQCVQSATLSDGSALDSFPDALGAQLSARMAELDPQAELTLQAACPACGRAFSAIFDMASYLARELTAGMRHLYREIHLLAYHYHWSPTEILAMSALTRRRYLQLLEEELTEGAAP